LRTGGSRRNLLALFLSTFWFLLSTASGRSSARSTAGLRVSSLAFLFSAPRLTGTRPGCRRSARLSIGPLPPLFSTPGLVRSSAGCGWSSGLLRPTSPMLTLLWDVRSPAGLTRRRSGNATLKLSFASAWGLRCLRSHTGLSRRCRSYFAALPTLSRLPAFCSSRRTLERWRCRTSR